MNYKRQITQNGHWSHKSYRLSNRASKEECTVLYLQTKATISWRTRPRGMCLGRTPRNAVEEIVTWKPILVSFSSYVVSSATILCGMQNAASTESSKREGGRAFEDSRSNRAVVRSNPSPRLLTRAMGLSKIYFGKIATYNHAIGHYRYSAPA